MLFFRGRKFQHKFQYTPFVHQEPKGDLRQRMKFRRTLDTRTRRRSSLHWLMLLVLILLGLRLLYPRIFDNLKLGTVQLESGDRLEREVPEDAAPNP